MNIDKFLIGAFFLGIGMLLGVNGSALDKSSHCEDFGKMKIYGKIYECKLI
jgi:hypothetical protein